MMENRLIHKLDVLKRFRGLEMRMKNAREERDRLKVEIAQAVKNNQSIESSSSRVASLEIELEALEQALSDVQGELDEIEAFEKSKDASDLRKRMSSLEVDHKKKYKAVRSDISSLINSLNSLFESLIEYDDVRKALGEGEYGLYGFSSILRKKPYNYVSRLRMHLDSWLRGAKMLEID